MALIGVCRINVALWTVAHAVTRSTRVTVSIQAANGSRYELKAAPSF